MCLHRTAVEASQRLRRRISDYIIRMAKRARIAIALVLLIGSVTVIGRSVSWIVVPMLLLAIFFIYWAMEQRATETFIRSLPMGLYLLKALDSVDAVLVARDWEYSQH